MNASANISDNIPNQVVPLIIGIGNPLRSDDGLAWAVVAQLARDHEADYRLRIVHQLTPELAQPMSEACMVILIDASTVGEAGELHVRTLSDHPQPGSVGPHHVTPEELAALTNAIYHQCPPIVIITVTGMNFDLGEQLSPLVAQSVPLAAAAVLALCKKDSL